MKIKRNEIHEEMIYVWQCPNCKDYNETHDDPQHDNEICCDSCGLTIEIED